MTAPTGAVDPYPVVHRLIAEQATAGEIEPVTGRQMGEAATLVAGALAALGLEPAVDGDVDHRTVERGRWLLDLLRRVELPEGGGPDAD